MWSLGHQSVLTTTPLFLSSSREIPMWTLVVWPQPSPDLRENSAKQSVGRFRFRTAQRLHANHERTVACEFVFQARDIGMDRATISPASAGQPRWRAYGHCRIPNSTQAEVGLPIPFSGAGLSWPEPQANAGQQLDFVSAQETLSRTSRKPNVLHLLTVWSIERDLRCCLLTAMFAFPEPSVR